MRPLRLLVLALAACGTTERPAGESAAGSDAGGPGGELASTRLDPDDPTCRPTEGALRCAGPGGYALLLADEEGRAVLTLVDADGTGHPVDAAHATRHAGPSRFGDHAEWWTVGRGRRIAPTALVVTHVAVRPDGPRNSAGERLDLLVVKLGDEVCITDLVPAAPQARVEARRLAQSAASRPCLESGPAPPS